MLYGRGWRLSGRHSFALFGLGLLGFFPRTIGVEPDLARALSCGPAAAMLVMAAAMGPISPQGRLTAWGLAVGDASYSLYLAHPFVLRPFRVLWIKVIGPRFDLIFLALAALGAVSVSLALYRVVERPISSRLQAWLKREIPRPNAQRVNFALRREA